MTGAKVSIDDEALRRGLSRLAELQIDPALKNIAMHLVQSTKRRIVAETAPDGSAWPALNADYAAAKRGPGKLRELGNAGGLMGSLTYVVSGGRVEVGSNKEHAAVHQFGAVIKPKKGDRLVFSIGGTKVFAKQVAIPARSYLGISADDRDEILQILADFVAGATGGPARMG